MIREVTLSKYPPEVRLALRLAARFLTGVDLPIANKLSQARFTEALRLALPKLEGKARHEILPTPEAWALRIVVNFALAQVRDAQRALGRLREELRGISRSARREPRLDKASAG